MLVSVFFTDNMWIWRHACLLLKHTFLFYLDQNRADSGIKEADQHWVFISKNATTVKAHIGSTAVLPCQVKKDSLYGMVSKHNNIFVSRYDQHDFVWYSLKLIIKYIWFLMDAK